MTAPGESCHEPGTLLDHAARRQAGPPATFPDVTEPASGALLAEAIRRHQAGDLEGAVAGYREVLCREPDSKPALWNLAVALKAVGDAAAAVEACRRLTAVDPADGTARLQLAHLLREAARPAEAAEQFRIAVAANPGNDAALVAWRETLQMLRRPADPQRKAVCIYSAIFGDYDDIHEPARQNLDCDYILFTDRPPDSDRSAWRVVTIDTGRLFPMHPRMVAKYFRTMGHAVFRMLSCMNYNAGLHDYHHLIWVDGSVRITSPDFAAFMIGAIGRHGLAMLKHPTRRCIYEEASASAGLRKYRHQPVLEQAAHYRREGYPENNGLMATTVIARDMRRRDLDAAFEAWWEENLRWSYQDQISLPYVLWKHGLSYDAIDMKLSDNPYFLWQVFSRKATSRVT